MSRAPSRIHGTRCRPAAGLLLGAALFACASRGTRPGSRAGSLPNDSIRPAGHVIDTFVISMPELENRRRTIRVYLPPGYDGRARFPVLYMQDAQQLFAPGPYGDWRLDETLDSLVAAGRSRGLIVVGIDNSAHRWDEYGPWVDDRMHAWVDSSWARATQGGEGAAYVHWIANTLKPEIDRRYRTISDREHTGIGGSSMGGLIALYAGLSRPDVFSKVMAMSTAAWFAETNEKWLSSNRFDTYISGLNLSQDVQFYVDVGTNERSRVRDPDVVDSLGRPVSYPRAYLEGSAAIVDALRSRGVPATNLHFVVDTGAVHHESAWSRRFGGAVTWLYR